MKKGLITALGTIVLAYAGGGYANAPIISGVPDVIISDAEDNDAVGSTADLNFFRYNNAMNIMNYIQDTDTAADQLNFAFLEDGTDTIDINGVTQLPSDSDPSLWPTANKQALSSSFMLSFRNIAYSPRRDGISDPPVGPEFDSPSGTTRDQEVVLSEREVTLFVADEANNKASDVITVYTKNAGADALSPTFTTLFTDNGFAGTWTYAGFSGVGSCTSTNSGYLGITSGAAATSAQSNAFYGRWMNATAGTTDAPIEQVSSNLIYCAKMRLQLDASTNSLKAFAPQLRLGAENAAQTFVTMNLINTPHFSSATPDENFNPQVPAVGGQLDYTFYWSPQADAPDLSGLVAGSLDFRKWRVFFDVLDINTSEGTIPEDSGSWRLAALEVGTLPRPDAVSPVTDTALGTGWAYDGFTGNPTGATAVASAGKVTFTVTSTSTAFALWKKADTFDWTTGKIQRVTANLSCPTEAARIAFPQARIRHNLAGGWVAHIQIIKSFAGLNAGMPEDVAVDADGTPYEAYVSNFSGPNATLAALPSLLKWSTSLDVIGAGAATNFTAHSVVFETLNDPRS